MDRIIRLTRARKGIIVFNGVLWVMVLASGVFLALLRIVRRHVGVTPVKAANRMFGFLHSRALLALFAVNMFLLLKLLCSGPRPSGDF